MRHIKLSLALVASIACLADISVAQDTPNPYQVTDKPDWWDAANSEQSGVANSPVEAAPFRVRQRYVTLSTTNLELGGQLMVRWGNSFSDPQDTPWNNLTYTVTVTGTNKDALKLSSSTVDVRGGQTFTIDTSSTPGRYWLLLVVSDPDGNKSMDCPLGPITVVAAAPQQDPPADNGGNPPPADNDTGDSEDENGLSGGALALLSSATVIPGEPLQLNLSGVANIATDAEVTFLIGDTEVAKSTNLTFDGLVPEGLNFAAYRLWARVKNPNSEKTHEVDSKLMLNVVDPAALSLGDINLSATEIKQGDNLTLASTIAGITSSCEVMLLAPAFGHGEDLISLDPTAGVVQITSASNLVGSHEFKLMVKRGDQELEKLVNLTVANVAPELKNLTLSSTTVPTGSADTTLTCEVDKVFGDTLTYLLTLNGGTATEHSSNVITLPAINRPGTHVVQVQVKDQHGALSQVLSVNLTVTNRAPTASLVLSTVNDVTEAPARVTVDASASTDPEGLPLRFVYQLNGYRPMNTDRTSIQVDLREPGEYTFTLTVTDSEGLTHEVTKTITLEAPEMLEDPVIHHGTDLRSGPVIDRSANVVRHGETNDKKAGNKRDKK